jgi:hypothetical protein
MAGRWDYSRERNGEPKLYGDETSYRLGAKWLSGLGTEDWGCGLGGFRKFYEGPGYLGIDESISPFANVVEKLEGRNAQPDGIFMRHVLEHNLTWRKILKQALGCFQKRMFLALFTPLEATDRVMTTSMVAYGVSVPDLALAKDDLESMVAPFLVRQEAVTSKTCYGKETLFYLEKPWFKLEA